MRKKLTTILFSLFIIAVLIFINSCKKAAPTEPQKSSAGKQTTPSGTTSFGTIAYTPDYSKEKSATLDTSTINISTTDASGIKWELKIPRQDISGETTISIIPIKNVKSDTVFNITNGVIFQPDGFQFSSPATLYVTVPQSSKKFFFYLFNQDGKKLDFAPVSDSGGVYVIPISHFSGAATGAPHNLSYYCGLATAKYQTALDEENNLLKQDIILPTPPDIDLECGMDSSKEKILDAYMKKFGLPEDTVIRNILGAASAMELAGCNPSTTNGSLAQAGPLAERLVKKAQTAYNQYIGDFKKYPAVAKAMLTANADYKLLGGQGNYQLLTDLGAFADNYFNYQLNKLRNDHDYKVIYSLYNLAAQAQLFGAEGAFLSKIRQAANFKFDINEDLMMLESPAGGSWVDTEHVVINGSINLMTISTNFGYDLEGQGNIDYVYGSAGDQCLENKQLQHGHDKIQLPQWFSKMVFIDSLNLCKRNYVSIYIDSLGSPSEQWDYAYDIPGGQFCWNWNTNQQNSANSTLTQDLNQTIFLGKKYFNYNNLLFTLHPAIHNGNVNAVDTTYETSYSQTSSSGSFSYSGKLHIQLVHTPQ